MAHLPTRRNALGAGSFLLLAPASVHGRGRTPGDPPIAVFFVRHAETEGSTRTTRDPGLSEKGRERAQSLARLLAKARVSALFSSEFQRTRDTLAPLAETLGLQIAELPAGEPERLTAELRELEPGTVALVAGHSNTVPALVAHLGGEMIDLVDDPRAGAVLDHGAHDRLVQVLFSVDETFPTHTIELRF